MMSSGAGLSSSAVFRAGAAMGLVAADRAAAAARIAAELVTPMLQAVQRTITRQLLDRAGLKADGGHGGAVTLITGRISWARLLERVLATT